MTITLYVLLSGLFLILVGIGLLGTLLGIRATEAEFGSLATGVIMAGYYVGYIVGTLVVPRIIRNVGHIRTFAALAATTASVVLCFALIVNPAAWLLFRIVNGLCVVGLYMTVESWMNEQTAGPQRGRAFSIYMMSTLLALGGGQFLILVGDAGDMVPYILAAMLVTLGVVPVAVTRVTEPRIELVKTVRLQDLMHMSPLGTIGAFAGGAVNGIFWGMAPVFGQRLALSELDIAVLMGATVLGGAVLQWPIGHLSDRFDRRNVLILVSFLTAGVAGVVAALIMEGLPGLPIAAGLYGGLMFSLYGISVAHTNDQLHPSEILEATRGLLLVYGIGAFCGPVMGGVAMELAGPVGLPIASSATAAGLALYGLYRLTQRVAPPVAEQTGFVPMVRTTPVALEMHPDADPGPTPDPGTGEAPGKDTLTPSDPR